MYCINVLRSNEPLLCSLVRDVFSLFMHAVCYRAILEPVCSNDKAQCEVVGSVYRNWFCKVMD